MQNIKIMIKSPQYVNPYFLLNFILITDCLEYAYNNGCPWPEYTERHMKKKTKCGFDPKKPSMIPPLFLFLFFLE